ncbi:hypothetical protein TraAM80_01707 [Trypanosoma rangeli]|uniref:Uncharacterized protein n=1 Tax=Trypanosoma rangeli TaxID=5698 RepID=A0A3R7NR55_TRYRA|nr:uncharacterized protein TraAM80_01707 [Trypanosoma rangeli]RNF10347.1 hypothetical protein TraAM80_01707 [Trypanosoma rangeli]|eukprot:RNF10347.1 hypothetical protein TraAM80_01707 [Trypanosoma rangeli]
MGTITQGMFAGSFIGVVYTAGYYAMTYYHKHRLKILSQQQLRQVPILTVSPELQPMYRAYLYDNRSLEEKDLLQRQAVVLSLGKEEVGLDAKGIIHNVVPEVVDWVNFPNWWPLKFPPTQTEEERMVLERKRNEEVEWQKRLILDWSLRAVPC